MKKLVIPIIFLLSIIGCSKAPFDIPEEELPKEISFIVEAVDEKGDEIIGAEILLDTVKIGETPFQGNIGRGSHAILVRKPGFKVYRNRFMVTMESSITEYAVLEKIEADDEDSGKVQVYVKVNQEAQIKISGVEGNELLVDTTSMELYTFLEVGIYNLEVSAEGFLPFTESFVLEPGKSKTFNVYLEKEEQEEEEEEGTSDDDSGIITIPVDVFVSADDELKVVHEAAAVTIEKSGYYRITATVEYDGNGEKNESYFLQVRNPEGNINVPENPNLLDLYKIVEDDGISSVHKAERYSGIFQMTQGINYLELHHYFEIAYNHPDFKNGDFNEDSVRITKFKLEWAGEL